MVCKIILSVIVIWPYGLLQSKADYPLFTKFPWNTYNAISIYVDDMILVGNDERVIKKVMSKHIGENTFMGLEKARSA